MFGDMDREKGIENAKKIAALEKEKLLTGVRERQEKKTAAQNERKFFNNWPQLRLRKRKEPMVKVMAVAQRKSREESVEDGLELVEEVFADAAIVFACENWIWNGGVGESLVQFNVFSIVH